jgi:exosome complex component CSL4
MVMTTAAATAAVAAPPPVLRFTEGAVVVPGDRLGNVRQVRAGEGTYVRGGHVYASLAGNLTIVANAEQQQQRGDRGNGTSGDDDVDDSDSHYQPQQAPPPPLFSCTVRAGGASPQGRVRLPATSQVLRIGQLVVGKVVRITPQNAVVDIRAAEHAGALRSPHEGAIRMEDVRTGATEQVALGDCFRPGDLVVCRVLSLGDSRRYFLSTAETELGVIRATTSRGVPMIPISWKEMECPETGVKELRKCAKPVHLRQINS